MAPIPLHAVLDGLARPDGDEVRARRLLSVALATLGWDPQKEAYTSQELLQLAVAVGRSELPPREVWTGPELRVVLEGVMPAIDELEALALGDAR